MRNTDLKQKIKLIPELPGVYQMLDSHRNIIYIGKSKCLKKRVQSYFTASPKWEKVTFMVSAIKDIDYIVTDTHLEARLLECKLIKEHKPRFNAQMKNDQNYFFLKIEASNLARPITITAERDEACFGPFRSKFAINELINRLRCIYPITDNMNRYDFEYHLFPITMDEETYERNRQLLLELFSSEEKLLLLYDSIVSKMEEAVSGYQYEMAAIFRDMARCLKIIKNGLDGYRNLASKKLLLKLPLEEGYKLFYVSKGSIINTRKLPVLSEEMLREFISSSEHLSEEHIQEETSEKSYIDFRDVLYSEIANLPEDQYEQL